MDEMRPRLIHSRALHRGVVCLLERWLLACFFLVFATSVHHALAAEPGQPKNVLILYSFSERSLFDPLDHLKSAIRSHLNAPVNFYVYYMEAQGLGDPSYERNLSETIRHELDGAKLDLMIVAAYPGRAAARAVQAPSMRSRHSATHCAAFGLCPRADQSHGSEKTGSAERLQDQETGTNSEQGDPVLGFSRMKLQEIRAGLSLAGVEPAQIVSVVATVPLGDDALQIIYRTPDGGNTDAVVAF